MANTLVAACSKVGTEWRREARGLPPGRASRRLAMAVSRAWGQGHEPDGAETQLAALAVDEEPLNPLLVSGRLDP